MSRPDPALTELSDSVAAGLGSGATVLRPDRCALAATARNDAMLGTAFPADRVLLVEQPGPWGGKGLAESGLDSAVATRLLAHCRSNGIRVQAIRRPGRTPAGLARRWAFFTSAPTGGAIRWGRFAKDAELLSTALPALGQAAPALGQADPTSAEPVYLVCTHGTHDLCCAIEGRPIAAALERLRPGQVFETTHLGGDRFAPNVLVLPLGVVYGRLAVEAAAEVVARTDRGEVMASHLRGLIGYPPAVQVALMRAQTYFGVARFGELRVLDSGAVQTTEPAREGRRTGVRIHAPMSDRTIEVMVASVADPPHLLTCQAEAPSRALRHQVMSIQEHPEAARG